MVIGTHLQYTQEYSRSCPVNCTYIFRYIFHVNKVLHRGPIGTLIRYVYNCGKMDGPFLRVVSPFLRVVSPFCDWQLKGTRFQSYEAHFCRETHCDLILWRVLHVSIDMSFRNCQYSAKRYENPRGLERL